MTLGRTARTAKAVVAALCLVAVPTGALADASSTYYERAFVLAANDRCRLFQPGVGAALSAAAQQSRGAALRSGLGEPALRAVADRARVQAAGVACGDPQLTLVKGRVENAFAGWARMPRMTFSGDRADWIANRAAYARPTWRLMQTSLTGASPVTFGYDGDETGRQRLSAVVSFVGRPRPNAARIVMRDVGLSPRPWLGSASALPPRSVRGGWWATASTTADAGLLAPGRKSGETWRFPVEAALALERLDPRETFAIEFHFRDDSVATATFEAGDFAAARAFLAMGSL